MRIHKYLDASAVPNEIGRQLLRPLPGQRIVFTKEQEAHGLLGVGNALSLRHDVMIV